MGGARAAGVNDLSALHWNPAGLSHTERGTFYGTYTSLYAGIQHGFVAYGTKIGRSEISGCRRYVFEFRGDGSDHPEFPEGSVRLFTVSDLALGLWSLRKLTDRLSVGETVKLINETIWRESASTFGFDIGSQFDTGIKGIQLGMSITNFSTKFKFDGPDLNIDVDTDPVYAGNPDTEARLNTGEWSLPLVFRLGIMVDLLGPESEIMPDPAHRLTLSFDANDPLDHFLRFNAGVEYSFREMLALRAGYRINYDQAGFSAGIGLDLDLNSFPLNIDYAIVNYGILGVVNQVSIQIGL
ncbi:MAG: PorV/PorQ family protein [Candidatus Marinimicrobia bacterium]|nr:PorV/PorQ family protein [Candidatus Neomarinimicrobiota bacterium]